MGNFKLASDFKPQGDQQQAIDKLLKSLTQGNQHQTLLGVTGSGKTFTMANLVANLNRPTLVMSHNKTLAAQLYSEFKNFFPDNAVEYFVSYFDYYQPEAYIPRTDTYIEKDSSINAEIERLRLSTMGSLITRPDTLVVASVSCIYGLGSPEDYEDMMVPIRVGMSMEREELLSNLVNLLFERNDVAFERGKFRVRGDVVDVFPAYLEDQAIRIEFFGDEIDRLSTIDVISGRTIDSIESHTFFPAKQFVTPKEKMRHAIVEIRKELNQRIAWFEQHGKLIEAQRLRMRTEYDIEMMEEMGFCQGIENYSRHLTGRPPGAKPGTLLDFFPDDFLLMVDESHVSIPQIGGMYEGDRSRKTVLVDHGFRLPSALDNRPLKFDEFMAATGQKVYVSATPATFELVNSRTDNRSFIPTKNKDDGSGVPYFKLKDLNLTPHSSNAPVEEFDTSSRGAQLVVEQIIRPTGLLDPVLDIQPLKGQIDKTIELSRQCVEQGDRVLITTLTKKTSEDLADYLQGVGLKVAYIHSDIGAIERVEILRSLRSGEIDVLVGINLLREGLDLPEVALVCILDADKEGFLRNETALIQTAGRAARHENGRCILFCDTITDSIQRLIDVTEYRRQRQMAHNKKHGITPKSVVRSIQKSLHHQPTKSKQAEQLNTNILAEDNLDYNVAQVLRELEEEMQKASAKLEFERAAHLRDQIKTLKQSQNL